MYSYLPEEATRCDKEEMVGLLKRAICGTRDALRCWQEHAKGVMEQLEFAAPVRLSEQDSQSCHLGSCG